MDQRIVHARRSVAEALRLDDEQHLKGAYQQYLSSLIYMYQILSADCQQINTLSELRTKDTERILRMARQCTDRVNELVSEGSTSSATDTGSTSASATSSCTTAASTGVTGPQQHPTLSVSSPAPVHSTAAVPQQQQHYVPATASIPPQHPQFSPLPTYQQSQAGSASISGGGTQESQERVAQLTEHLRSTDASGARSMPVPTSSTAQSLNTGPSLLRHASASASLATTSTGAPERGSLVASQLSPVDLMRQRNQQLMTSYQKRMQKMHASGMSAASITRMNMTMMRQLQENMAIAKSREAALNQKIQERQRRIAEEHRQRLEEARDPLDHKQLVLDVGSFEKNLTWANEKRKKIAENPEDSECISAFINHVFSTTDHPLSKKLGLLQYQLYHTLLPLAKQASTPTANMPAAASGLMTTITMPTHRDHRSSSTTQSTDMRSTADSLSVNTGPQRGWILSDPSLEDDEGALATVLDMLGITEPTENANGATGSSSTQGETDELCVSDEHGSRTSSPMPAPGHISPKDILEFGKSLCSSQELELADVCTAALTDIVKDIHGAIHILEVAMLVVYEELRTPAGRDQCHVAIEKNLFPPLWPHLLDVLRLSNVCKEKAFVTGLNLSRMKSMIEMGIPENFRLGSDELGNQPDGQPYVEAITELRRIPTLSIPLEKLECVVAVTRCICKAAEDYFVSIGKSRMEASIGCDDLLPILGYCIVQASIPQLTSECAAMLEFIHEGYLMGEEGYCLTTLETALSHVSSLAIPRPT